MLALIVAAVVQSLVVMPPSFPRPVRAIYSSGGPVEFDVRVVKHPDIHTLRVELWETSVVGYGEMNPSVTGLEIPEGMMGRVEPRTKRRSSDLVVWPDQTVYRIKWLPVPPGDYQIQARVITHQKSVQAVRNIKVM